jgi:hypothetical protein
MDEMRQTLPLTFPSEWACCRAKEMERVQKALETADAEAISHVSTSMQVEVQIT